MVPIIQRARFDFSPTPPEALLAAPALIISQGDNPTLVQEKLQAFISPTKRTEVKPSV